MRLDGKIALVTGASHGIGKATALLFAREGADVAITTGDARRERWRPPGRLRRWGGARPTAHPARPRPRRLHPPAAPPRTRPGDVVAGGQGQVERGAVVVVLDDSTLDKPYAVKMELVHRHWPGKHWAVVEGINLITLVRTDGDAVVPCDWRIFDKLRDGSTKNDHFAAMLLTARQRAFQPECVLFDGWCATAAGAGSRSSAATAR